MLSYKNIKLNMYLKLLEVDWREKIGLIEGSTEIEIQYNTFLFLCEIPPPKKKQQNKN